MLADTHLVFGTGDWSHIKDSGPAYKLLRSCLSSIGILNVLLRKTWEQIDSRLSVCLPAHLFLFETGLVEPRLALNLLNVLRILLLQSPSAGLTGTCPTLCSAENGTEGSVCGRQVLSRVNCISSPKNQIRVVNLFFFLFFLNLAPKGNEKGVKHWGEIWN